MAIYAPWALIFLLAIPLIVLLYMFKQRYVDYTVSSIYLWQEAVKSIENSAPWRRFLKNLLMLLEILALALLAFTLSRPYLNLGEGNKKIIVMVLDSSMSMEAKDTKPTRFDAARKEADGIISNLEPGTRVTLISMGANTEIEENLNSNKSSLRRRIASLQPESCTANYEEAASVLQSVVRQNPESEVYLFGDRALKVSGVPIRFFDYSSGGENYAVLLLSHSSGKDGITALSTVANYSNEDVTIPVSLYVDGRVFDAKDVKIKSNDTAAVNWDNIPSGSAVLECKIDSEDSLDADNSACDPVNSQSGNRVLLAGCKNTFIQKALGVIKGIRLYKTDVNKKSVLKGYDLYVFDGYMPEELPQDGNIMVFNPPENKYFKVGKEVPVTAIDRSSNVLFNNIHNYSFSIESSKKMETPAWGEPVLQSGGSPLIVSGTLESRRLVVFGFDLHNSDIALTTAFPVLMSNCIDWLMPSRVDSIGNLVAGQPVQFNISPNAERVSVRTPSGRNVELAPPFPAGIFSDTRETGLYMLEQKLPEKLIKYNFAVNAPSGPESDLRSGSVNTGEDYKSGPAVKTGFKTSKSLQILLIWVILLILLSEWWVYRYDI